MINAPEEATELTATQYVILAENQRKKKALSDTKNKYSQLLEDNKKLTQQWDDGQRENYQVIEYLRCELLAKNQRIADLEAELTKARADREYDVGKLEEQAAVREAGLMEELGAQLSELQARLADAESQLASVAEFRGRQAEVEGSLLTLKEEKRELTAKLASQQQELERYYVEVSARQKREYEQRLEELKKAAEEEADERLDASIKRILNQNRRMAEELRLHVEESEILREEVKILETDRAKLMREVALKVELEDGFAKRGAKQATTIKEAHAKIAALEASLQQVLQDFEKERASMQATAQAQIDDARAEADALKRLIKLKTRELKNVRRLAQEVLLQRSDVEIFLLSSLHFVRQELERESLEASNLEQQASSTTFITAQRTDPATRSNIKTMSWAERERVLKLMLAKVNDQAQVTQFNSLAAKKMLGGDTDASGTADRGPPPALPADGWRAAASVGVSAVKGSY